MRRLVLFLALTSLIAGIFGGALPAQAASTVGSFEIDGDRDVDHAVPPTEPLDWESPPPNLTHFNDATGQSDDSFNTGSKELIPEGSKGWDCQTGSAPGKGDITSGDIAFRTFPPGGDQFIYVDFFRATTSGDVHIDYEFNQGTTPNPQCPALPRRTNGDIAITFDTEQGGKTILVRAFRWTFTSGTFNTGTYTELPLGSKGTTFDGATNKLPGDNSPDAGNFGEAALNLTDTIGPIACGQFATAHMKSRSSTSITSALQDRTATQPANVGECPNSQLAKAVKNVTTGGSFATTASASPGDTLEYQLTYTNTGAVAATNVQVTDVIQAKQTLVPGSCSPACTGTGTAADPLKWTFASVAPGGMQVMTFRVVLDVSFPAGTTQVKNVAVVDTAEEAPKNSNETTTTVTATPNSSLAKAVKNVTTGGSFATTANASPGDILEYQLTYTNTGNVPLTNVEITDVIQAKQTFVGGSCTPACTGTGTAANPLKWTFASVGVGGSQVMTFRVTLDPSFPAGTTDVKNVAVSDSTEENPKNSNETTVTVTAAPNLGLVKSGSAVGTRITYTIDYSNTGNAPATMVTISDSIPAGTVFFSCSQNPPCTTTGMPVTSVSWNIGTVNPGGTGSVTLTVDVIGTDGCRICNVASISSPDQTGGSRNSNESCVDVTPGPDPAGAHASGDATGANIFSSLLGLDLTLPTGNDLPAPDHTSVDSSQAGLGSNSEQNALLEILPPPGDTVLRADVLRAVSTSTITDNPARASAISVGSAANVNILNGTVTASLVRGVASAEATGTSVNVNSLGSGIEGLTVLGIPQAVFPGAKVDLPAAIFGPGSYVAIYEEVKNTSTPAGTSGGTYAGDITVNMIRVHVTGMLVVGQVEVVVGHARAQADFPQTTLCGPQANQSVSGDAFMARLLTDPDIAPILVGAVQLPTSGGAASNSVNTIVVDPVLTSRAATTSTSGSFTPLNTTATSSAEVKGLCLLETAGVCTIKATLVRAQANSTATGSNRTSNATGTDFVALKVASLNVSLPVPANTVIAVPGVGFVILNEQFCDNGGTLASSCSNGTVPGHTGITVRAVHLVLLEPDPVGGTPGVDLIVAEAHSDARYV